MKRIVGLIFGLVLIALLVMIWIDVNREELDNRFLDEELAKIEDYIEFGDAQNRNISKVSVDWHLYHTLLTIDKIYRSMEASNPKEYVGGFSFARLLMFTFNRIPRGRAESPEVVRPPEIIKKDSIVSYLSRAKALSKKYGKLSQNAYFEHPVAGKLNRKNTKLFLKIHTNHHLKIIEDILTRKK